MTTTYSSATGHSRVVEAVLSESTRWLRIVGRVRPVEGGGTGQPDAPPDAVPTASPLAGANVGGVRA